MRSFWYYIKADGAQLKVVTFDNGPDGFSEGLGATIVQAKNQFEKLICERVGAGLPIFCRLALLDANGAILIDSGDKHADFPCRSTLTSEVGNSAPAWHGEPSSGLVDLHVPVHFSKQVAGEVAGWVNLRPFLDSLAGPANTERMSRKSHPLGIGRAGTG